MNPVSAYSWNPSSCTHIAFLGNLKVGPTMSCARRLEFRNSFNRGRTDDGSVAPPCDYNRFATLGPCNLQGICNLFSSAQLLLSRCYRLLNAFDDMISKGHWGGRQHRKREGPIFGSPSRQN